MVLSSVQSDRVNRFDREQGDSSEWHSLSAIQRSLWFLYEMEPEQRRFYNNAFTARACPAIDPEALQRALDAMVVRHAMLRTSFALRDGVAMQRVQDHARLKVSVVDVESLDAPDMGERVMTGRFSAFELAAAPLARAILYRDSSNESVIVLAFDHLVTDGWSLWLLLEELGVRLRAETTGEAALELSPVPSFLESVAEQKQWLASPAGMRQLAYWQGELTEPCPPLTILPDHQRARDGRENARETARLILPSTMTDGFHALAEKHGVTVLSVFLTSFFILLSRLSGQQRVAVGCPMPGRGKAWGHTVGNFANPIVLNADLKPELKVAELLKQVNSTVWRGLKNQSYPLAELVERLNPQRVQFGQPYYQALFSYQKARSASDLIGLFSHCEEIGRIPWGGVELRSFGTPQTGGGVGMDLVLEMAEVGTHFMCTLDFDKSKFERATVERYGHCWHELLQSMLEDDEQLVSATRMLPAAERFQMLSTWNATDQAFPLDRCVHEIFETQAARTPDKLAVVCGARRLSYAELNARANQLARYLRSCGVGPDCRVALCVERSELMPMALLAVLKAGGAYVPLDACYPPERLAFMLSDSAPVVILSHGSATTTVARHLRNQDGHPQPSRLLDLDADSHLWSELPSQNLERDDLALTARSLAYVIYTSGSTGTPKGVMIEHRAAVNYSLDAIRWFGLCSDDVVLQQNSLSFDLSLEETLPTLLSGATLAPSNSLFGLGAEQSIRPTVIHLTAAHWHTLVGEWVQAREQAQSQLQSVRLINVTGDALSAHRLEQWEGVRPKWTQLINTYGPTETTISCTAAYVQHVPGVTRVSIGKPFANTRIYILDSHKQPVPIGVAGEMYIGGVGVGRGYLNLDELTAERFPSDPFSSASGARMYKTGDMARWRPNGEIEFVARTDTQVKVRGFRIELGEVEDHLARVPGVRDVAVVVREYGAGEKRMLAYYVGAMDPERLRASAVQGLPEYMVPQAFVQLERLPLTPAGKLDRKSLPVPDEQTGAQPAYEPPVGNTEEVLAAIWTDLLKVERVGRHDNFFERGGHSLLAITLIERMRQRGLMIEVRRLFGNPTLSALAQAVSLTSAQSPSGQPIPPNGIPDGCMQVMPAMLPLVALSQEEIDRIAARVPGGGANIQDIYPLAPLQEGFVFHHLLQTSGDVYLISALLGFDSRQRLEAFAQVLNRVIARHDILRTAVHWEGLSKPVQVVFRQARFEYEVLELPPDEVEARLLAQADCRRLRLDIRHAPLMHGFAAFDSNGNRWLLQFVYHHLIMDHTALERLVEEVALIQQGRESELGAVVPFRNFVARAQVAGTQADHEAFFRAQLGTIEQPTAPFGLLETQGDGSALREARLDIDPSLAQRVRDQAQRRAVSVASLFHLVFAQVLAKTSGHEDVVFGTVLSGRVQGGAAEGQVMGMFVNTLPLRVQLGEHSIAQCLKGVHLQLVSLLQHEQAPLAVAQRCSALPNSVPLFSSLLNYRYGQVMNGASPLGLEGMRFLESKERTNYPLEVSVDDLGDDFSIVVRALESIGAERLCQFVRTGLESLIRLLEGAPDAPARTVEVLPRKEWELVTRVFNDTKRPFPEKVLVHELFERQAHRSPRAIAVQCEADELSYRELNARANRLARALQERGVGRGDFVAIQLERSIELVTAQVAILKCGAAYVPLDGQAPMSRHEFVVQDCQARLVLAQRGRVVPSGVERLDIDCIDMHQGDDRNLVTQLDSKEAAYVMYTSGSTGVPRGVVVPHRAIVRLVVANGFSEFLPEDRMSFAANPAFDAATLEVWAPLLNGGRVVVIAQDVLLEPPRLVKQLLTAKVDTMWMTVGLFNQMADVLAPVWPQLKTLVIGGDALDPTTVDRVLKNCAPHRLLNGYGPTETTVFAATYPIRQVPEGATSIPIGYPIGNTQIYILDRHLQPVAVGVTGELYIGGAGVARGYLNRPELTAERFIPDPFSSESEGRMYKTGDLGRWRQDGAIEFLGRNDLQIKLRGFRIELGEIEAQLGRLTGVREAVVIAHPDRAGDKRLVAYVVGESGATGNGGAVLEPVELRRELSRVLPQYMVPGAFVQLERLPLNANGKIDRQSLPAPDAQAFVQHGYVAPEGELEQSLAAIWGELLNLEQVGRGDDFFELGGHSLLAVQLVSQLRQRFNVEVTLSSLFAHPVLSELAVQVGQAAQNALGAITVADRSQALPLSFAQQRLWFIAQMDEQASMAYHIAGGLRLRGSLDESALRAALDRIVERHEVLRTRFVTQEGQATQSIEAGRGFPLRRLEMVGATEAQVVERASREAATPFELSSGNLIRGCLLSLGPSENVLLVTMHHIVSDGWSIGVLTRELCALYTAFSQGQPDPLPPLTLQYADYAQWQRQWLQGPVLKEQLQYWVEQLRGAPELVSLPTDRARPEVQDYSGAKLEVRVEPALSEGVKALGLRHGTTLYMTLLAAWAAVVSRLSGQQDVVIGSPVANRRRAEVEGLIGLFVNTQVLRIDLSAEPTVTELLGQVRQTALAAQDRQDVPFEQVVEALNPSRTMAHSAVFQLLFNWQNTPEERLELGELSVESLQTEGLFAKFDLALELREQGEGIEGSISYATALFDESTIQRHWQYLLAMLRGMVANAEQSVGRIELLDAAERNRLLYGFNETARDYPRDVLIHELFEQQVEAHPDAIAVQFEEQQLSYRELNARANRLAYHLRSLGVEPDSLVAVCMERSLEMVLAVVAAVKAGAAYLPLDPHYPLQRLSQMLQEATPAVALVDNAGLQALGEQDTCRLHVLHLLEDSAAWSDAPLGNPARMGLCASHLAYVIYTSGSTGLPKGAMNEHRGIVNRLFSMQETYRLGDDDVLLQKTPFSFDVSVWEFFWPLMAGARLRVARPEGHKDPSYLCQEVCRGSVTTLHFVPSMLKSFLECPEVSACAKVLRRVMCGGEALTSALVARFHERLPGVELYNLYGPAEAAVDVTAWACTPVAESQSIPIGRPLANTRMYVLDESLRPVPIGVVGELYVGGIQVARGYLNRPELTAERFMANPFISDPEERMYKTGDLGRWREDGAIEYLGRNDFQVKIRGFRIELGEIEAQLARLPAVREAVVVAREDEPGDKRLVAYLVMQTAGTGEDTSSDASAETAPPLEPAALRDALSAVLPEHMVPAAFVQLEALPLSPNGKLDRRALPAPQAEAFVQRGYEAPVGEIEETLAAIWSELLWVEQVGRNDNFFELGGHSLLAVQLVSHLRQRLNVELSPGSLFAHPVLSELAVEVERAAQNCLSAITIVDRSQPLLLSFPQQRLWFIYQMDERASAAYHMGGALRLRGLLDESALRAALDRIVERHEILRTRIVTRDGQGFQCIDSPQAFELTVVELPDGTEEQVAAEASTEVGRPFYLACGPLIRGRMLRLSPTDHVLLVTMHHIISDGWSISNVFPRELCALYTAFVHREPDPLPPLAIQYADYAQWQRQWIQGPMLQKQLQFWVDHLRGAPESVSLPTDRPRPDIQDYRGAWLDVGLDSSLSQALKALSQQHGTTLYMTLLAAWAAVVSRLSGQEEVVIGSPVANRTRAEIEGLIGFFVNTQALRISLHGEPTVAELLAQVQRVALEAQSNQDVPFEQVVEAVNPTRSMAHSAIFQLRFSWQNTPREELSLEGLTLEGLRGARDTTQFELRLDLQEQDDRIVGSMAYATTLFDESTIRRHWQYLQAMLRGMVANPHQRTSTVALLDEAERDCVLKQFNATARSSCSADLVHERIAKRAHERPMSVAVLCGDQRLEFRELNARANRLARYLRKLGVRPNSRVALCLHRSAELMVGVLAILKASGAYVPIDPDYPSERLSYMLQDCDPVAILTHARLSDGVKAQIALAADQGEKRIPVLDVHADETFWDSEPCHDLDDLGLRDEHLAYVIYTSGSTGHPKGAQVHHGGLRNLMDWFVHDLEFSDEYKVLVATSHGFDQAQRNLLGPLLVGGQLHLAPAFFEPHALLDQIERDGINYLNMTPSAFHSLMEAAQAGELPYRRLRNLRRLMLGGEPIQLSRLLELPTPRPQIINNYGPTECSAVVAYHILEEPLERYRSRGVPLGRPIRNTRLYVLDSYHQPTPIGVIGELYIAGAGVGPGYMNRPEQSAERFLNDPFESGQLMYKSGDLARWNAAGELEFLGRNDSQVKLRGFRIELGEIEVQLLRLPGIREATVIVREDPPLDKRLVAYVVPQTTLAHPVVPVLEPAELRRALSTVLPEYMIPAAFVQLDQLPRTPNFKLDRKALPPPEGDAFAKRTYEEPVGEVETTLAAIWSDLLKIDKVGRHDNFFELGGHSLLVVTLIERMRRQGLYADIASLFAAQTLAQSAALIGNVSSLVEVPPNLIPERPEEDSADAEEEFEVFKL